MLCLPVLLAGMRDSGTNSLLILELGRGPYQRINSVAKYVLESIMSWQIARLYLLNRAEWTKHRIIGSKIES